MNFNGPKFIICLLFTTVSLGSISQNSDLEIVKSDEISHLNKLLAIDFIPLENGENLYFNIYGWSNIETFDFKLFDSNLKLIKKNVVDVVGKLDIHTRPLKVIKLKNKIVVLLRKTFPDEQKEGVLAWRLDLQTLNFIGEPHLLFKSSRKVIMPISNLIYMDVKDNGGFGSNYKIELSKDSTSFMICFRLYPLDKKDINNIDEFGFYLFNENFDKLIGNEYTMPYLDSQVCVVADVIIKNNSTLFILVHIFPGSSTKWYLTDYKQKEFHYELITINNSDVSLKSSPIKSEHKLFTANFFQINDDEICLSGVYSNTKNNTGGIYIMDIRVYTD